jgi:hypothetical protein
LNNASEFKKTIFGYRGNSWRAIDYANAHHEKSRQSRAILTGKMKSYSMPIPERGRPEMTSQWLAFCNFRGYVVPDHARCEIGMAFGAHLSGGKAYWLPIRRWFSGNYIEAYWVLDDQGLPSP